MSKSIEIAGRKIGAGGPTFIIAEVAQAHDGSLEVAHAYIDAVAASGADAVKFQTHIAEAESSAFEPWRVQFSARDATRFDYWKRMEFTAEQWAELKSHADRTGIVFLSSPFSDKAVELLENIGMPAWKIASGEVNNLMMLDRIARTGKPVLISSGMSPVAELDSVVNRLRQQEIPVAVLQCSSKYPTPPEELGLNLLADFRARYNCPVGLSDHSGTLAAGLAATALGADLIEVHVIFDRDDPGPDAPASLTTVELRGMVDGVRFIDRALASPVDKDAVAPEFVDLRRIFTKSLFAARVLAPGARLRREDLLAKKPGTGISVETIDSMIGREIAVQVQAGSMLRQADLVPVAGITPKGST